MRIQIASDLHVTYNNSLCQRQTSKKILTRDPFANHLIIAGDIGEIAKSQYKHFLAYLHDLRYEKVWIVPGNHEYYYSDFPTTHAKMLEYQKEFPTIEFVNKKEIQLLTNKKDANGLRSNIDIDFPNEHRLIRLLFTTLWSEIPDIYADECRRSVNDFNQIKGFDISEFNRMHQECKAWLTDRLNDTNIINAYIEEIAPQKDLEVTTVVITHHAPTSAGTIPAAYISETALNSAFANRNLEHLLPMADIWVHGHSHKCHDDIHNFEGKSVRILANTHGYGNECQKLNSDKKYDNAFSLNI